ncbi:aspartyl-phosphate phosphatase Spo0E family protein [Terrisporobacter petrolearius]|uniref:aspartyl-phosphate phosphatase Spo0E family protein n=1 Tax=Terrisporobacter petrolearius TaxID=1460447 RepID=UPI001D161CA4|nr:aspartyl-phosphate phosphatase Spo0E family protein [Terrisporobacter petrolearius]MCC3866005.1 aspartyl-phosphate phosphatase Spo0E family protein [Terrisporobacter petrolearius]
MDKSELEALKKEIEEVRELINTYIEYPEIFRDELVESSKKIDMLINEYIKRASDPQ